MTPPFAIKVAQEFRVEEWAGVVDQLLLQEDRLLLRSKLSGFWEIKFDESGVRGSALLFSSRLL